MNLADTVSLLNPESTSSWSLRSVLTLPLLSSKFVLLLLIHLIFIIKPLYYINLNVDKEPVDIVTLSYHEKVCLVLA